MPREPRNIGASVRARLLDRVRAEGSDFQILLTRYALERLLYRLSISVHRDRFILKGAMLFVTWVADPFRPTRDLDLLGYGDNGAEVLADTFRAICAQLVADDGVTFDAAGLEAAPIREEAEYGGVRVRTTAMIAGARIPIQVDIGFGDARGRDDPGQLGRPLGQRAGLIGTQDTHRRRFIHRRSQRLAHLRRHHPGERFFLILQNGRGFQHPLRAQRERDIAIGCERLDGLLKLCFDCRAAKRLEGLYYLSRCWIDCGDRHGWPPQRYLAQMRGPFGRIRLKES